MSSDHVRRSVKGRQSRVAGSAPTLGRVARMPGVGAPKGERRSRRRGERGTMSRTAKWNAALTLGWSVGLGVAAIACVVAAVVLWIKPMVGRHEEGKTAEPGIQVRVKSKFPAPSEEDAVAMVKRVVEQGEGAEAMMRTGRMSWEEIGDFLAGRESKDGTVTNYEWIGVLDDNNLQIESVLVYSEKEGKTKIRPAFLTPDENGVWRVDLPSFARRTVPSWSELLDGGAETGVVRVYLGEDSYYNAAFRDEREWASYGMIDPDGDELMVGYCRVGSKQHAAMIEIQNRSLVKERQVGYATLELRRREGGERRQFEITQVIAEGWVTGELIFEDAVARAAEGP